MNAPYQSQQSRSDAAIRFAIGQCSLGAVLVARNPKGICAILLGDEPDPLLQSLQVLFPNSELVGADADFAPVMSQVIEFVESPSQGLPLPLDLQGTPFQLRVWGALREIPTGHTVSYTELAERLGCPGAVRAVASACAANRIAVAIPCHRVVRRNGDISGYRWGVARKHELLQREADVCTA